MFSICFPLLFLLALSHSVTSPPFVAASRVSSLFLDRNSYGDEGKDEGKGTTGIAAGNTYTNPIHDSDFFPVSHSPLFKEAPAFRNGAECAMKASEMERASRLGFNSDGDDDLMEMEMLCDPSSVHIAMTLDMAYMRGSMAAILSIVQHTSCPENVVFHFLASSSSSSSSSPSPSPTSSSFLQESMASGPLLKPSSMASSSMPPPPLLTSSSSSSSSSSLPSSSKSSSSLPSSSSKSSSSSSLPSKSKSKSSSSSSSKSSKSSSSPPPPSPSPITVTALADLIRSAFPYLRFHVYPFDPALVIHRISPSIRNALEQPLNYARIYIADLLPECIGRVIYLDSDIVVVDDIIKLWKTPLDRHPIAAPEYCHADFTKYFTDSFWNRARLSSVFDDRARAPCYFNTGVMVMDLHEWRARGFTQKIEGWMDVQKAWRIYELGSLPPFLLVFAGDIEPVDHRWNQHGLGGDNVEGKCRGLHEGPVSLLHWSGKGKPWDRLDARKPCPLDSLWAPYDLSILSSSSPSSPSGSGYGM